jgi:hypothetical protein
MMTDPVEQAMQQYDQQGCLHEQFVKQAKATPDAIAVVTHTGHKVKKKLAPFGALLPNPGTGYNKSILEFISYKTGCFIYFRVLPHLLLIWYYRVQSKLYGTVRRPGLSGTTETHPHAILEGLWVTCYKQL